MTVANGFQRYIKRLCRETQLYVVLFGPSIGSAYAGCNGVGSTSELIDGQWMTAGVFYGVEGDEDTFKDMTYISASGSIASRG